MTGDYMAPWFAAVVITVAWSVWAIIAWRESRRRGR